MRVRVRVRVLTCVRLSEVRGPVLLMTAAVAPAHFLHRDCVPAIPLGGLRGRAPALAAHHTGLALARRLRLVATLPVFR